MPSPDAGPPPGSSSGVACTGSSGMASPQCGWDRLGLAALPVILFSQPDRRLVAACKATPAAGERDELTGRIGAELHHGGECRRLSLRLIEDPSPDSHEDAGRTCETCPVA